MPQPPARSHSPPPLAPDGVNDPEAAKHADALAEYLAQMSEEQALAYKIAFKTLGHSYSIVRSQGFQKWLSKRA
jgi:ABC-type sugar transport system substrate-binding protein